MKMFFRDLVPPWRDWKNFSPLFQTLEKRADARSGSALIVALWVLLVLSLLIGAFAFDMHIQAGITSFYRKRLRSQYLAAAGMEYAKLVLAQSYEVSDEFPPDEMEEEDYFRALRLKRGGQISASQELGEGRFTLEIKPEEKRGNIRKMTDENWADVFDRAGVPQEKWDELIACLRDWEDPDDDHRLLGAESDDSFYVRRGYECKNAPVDTVDELLLIKGFTHSLLYGGPSDYVEGETLTGIAQWLTVWGDGKIAINSATLDELMLFTDLEDFEVEEIMRVQQDAAQSESPAVGEGLFKNMEDLRSRMPTIRPEVLGQLTISEPSIVRVVSIGESYGVRSGAWAVLQADKSGVKPLFWREEPMP